MTIHINGVQVDIQAAIVINSITGTQVSFQHIYFARLIGENAETENLKDPCIPNPCKNNSLCLPTENNNYSCLRSSMFSGYNINHKTKPFCITSLNLGSTFQMTTTLLFTDNIFQDQNKILTTTIIPSKCFPNPCLNGAGCVINNLTTTKYTCYCISGYTGEVILKIRNLKLKIIKFSQKGPTCSIQSSNHGRIGISGLTINEAFKNYENILRLKRNSKIQELSK